MYKAVVLLCAVVVLGAPQEKPEQAAPAPTSVLGLEHNNTVIPIISQSEELEPNGTYKFSFETGNGIKREEISYDKILPAVQGRSSSGDGSNDTDDEIHVQQGSYSYTAPDGTLISLRYTADENGFQPIGDHIPTSPPVPEAIQKSLNDQSADQPQAASLRESKKLPLSSPAPSSPAVAPEEPSKAPEESAPSTPEAPPAEASGSENPEALVSTAGSEAASTAAPEPTSTAAPADSSTQAATTEAA